jgi:hypothetical protein
MKVIYAIGLGIVLGCLFAGMYDILSIAASL